MVRFPLGNWSGVSFFFFFFFFLADARCSVAASGHWALVAYPHGRFLVASWAKLGFIRDSASSGVNSRNVQRYRLGPWRSGFSSRSPCWCPCLAASLRTFMFCCSFCTRGLRRGSGMMSVAPRRNQAALIHPARRARRVHRMTLPKCQKPRHPRACYVCASSTRCVAAVRLQWQKVRLVRMGHHRPPRQLFWLDVAGHGRTLRLGSAR